MKRIRTHYDNLKVARNAPPEVIRAAYKSLSQKYHPDRNPERHDAARIMTLINAAYEELSDPAKRRQHDKWIESQEVTEFAQARSAEHPSQSKSSFDFKSPKAGNWEFTNFPYEVKKKIVARTQDTNQQQFAVKTDGVAHSYVWTVVISGWFIYLFNDAEKYRWSDENLLWAGAFTSVTAFLLSKNISWIIRWHLSPIRCWLIVTPLYVIKTEFNRIWYWPIWSISDIKGTHNYHNGAYQDTSLKISFDGKSEPFKLAHESLYDQMIFTLKSFENSYRLAVDKGDFEYIARNDDFSGCHNGGSTAKHRTIDKRSALVFAVTFIISGMLFTIAFFHNSEQPYKPTSLGLDFTKEIPYTSSQPVTKKNYLRPNAAPNGEPWPYTAAYVPGYEKLFTDGLSTVTIDNTRHNSDVFVKLVSLNGVDAFPVRIFFVPANEQFTLGQVREGTYDIRYRDLDSGTLARSESFRLLEQSTYDGVKYSNITMTLYKVLNGNMQTYDLSESEF